MAEANHSQGGTTSRAIDKEGNAVANGEGTLSQVTYVQDIRQEVSTDSSADSGEED